MWAGGCEDSHGALMVFKGLHGTVSLELRGKAAKVTLGLLEVTALGTVS